jgi:hypothetical protein
MTVNRHVPSPGDPELTNITKLLIESEVLKKAMLSLRKLIPSIAILNKLMVTAL